jgi:hypothetical protein
MIWSMVMAWSHAGFYAEHAGMINENPSLTGGDMRYYNKNIPEVMGRSILVNRRICLLSNNPEKSGLFTGWD